MPQHDPLPVAGYKAQSSESVDVVNANKQLEERVIRRIEEHRNYGSSVDQRMVAIALTKAQEAFMWLNRAVFQPGRVKLPEDE